jgi:hypothetical protein
MHQPQLAPICILHSYAVAVGVYASSNIDDCVFAYCHEVGVPCANPEQAQRAISGLFPENEQKGRYGSGYRYLKSLHDQGQHIFFRKAKANCKCEVEAFTEADLMVALKTDDTLVTLVCLCQCQAGSLTAHSILVTYDVAADQLVVADPNQPVVSVGQPSIRDALDGMIYKNWNWGEQLVFTPR